MTKKMEGFVTKGNRQIKEGNIPGALKTVADGLDYYQNKVAKAVNPYPESDAALLVTVFRVLADTIESQNPDCKPLVADLQKRAIAPEFQSKTKFHKTKKR